jgi:uncharacterized membrane protein
MASARNGRRIIDPSHPYRGDHPSIAGLNAEHHANATHHQRAVDRITSSLGDSAFIATPTDYFVGWVSLDCFALALSGGAPDLPPFA